MTGRMAGKSVLVTGAASGIGRATALRMAREGAQVMLADINESGMLATADLIAQEGGLEARTCYFDALDTQSCRRTVGATIDAFGQLDVVCNVAGFAGAWHSHEMPEADWDRMVAINLTSMFVICQEAIPALLDVGGNIINISSAAGKIGQAYHACYCATKSAVIGLSKALAMEYAKAGIRVNALCPGGTNTPLLSDYHFPENYDPALIERLLPKLPQASPEEIAGAIVFICSDEGRYFTGAAVSLDGGQTAG